MEAQKYKRVLIKISGEALEQKAESSGKQSHTTSP